MLVIWFYFLYCLEKETMQQEIQCPVCLNNTPTEWVCSECHNHFHLLCILQWTLRLVMNGRKVNEFTCPSCRHVHDIRSLPGFEESEPSQDDDESSFHDTETLGDEEPIRTGVTIKAQSVTFHIATLNLQTP